MTSSQLRARYWRIVFFFARVTASFIWFEIVLRRLKMGGFVARTRAERTRKAAARFRVLAISMGGLMIKVGQFLSARLDVLPPEVIKELADLQDEVPPEEFVAVQAVAESELALPLSKQFASFDRVPLAAASLGQVHRATLLAGDAAEVGFADVVVKVQRPDIQQIIEVDLSALRTVGGWLERYRPIRNRADIRALIEEFAKTTLEEVDYLEEAVNLDAFAANFAQDPRVATPAVLWELSGRRLLTLQDVSAIKLTDRDAVTAAGIDPVEVAQVLADTFLQQILIDGFFHADPHPGNIFVTPRTDSSAADLDWTMTFIDFGMFGRVPEELRGGLRDLLIAAGLRDSTRFVAGLQRLDLLLPSADLWQIESAAEQVFDRFGGLRIDELQQIDPEELIRFGLQFRELLLELPFQVPKDLLLLGRAVGILSGNCTALDPEFDIWGTITPYATQLLDEDRSSLSETVQKEAIELGRLALTLPSRADRVLTLAERGQLKVDMPALARNSRGCNGLQPALTGY
ncbi:AarF/ABC1/UbiB kinase family protein [Ornithinimicrobium sp. INDO-MA30-4]|uniref:ABC1 kinase family protein n=1 Tax=Ornithinimicrobium sp. INDO-MA30-4 TaxID=2908651 RepID=UPI001F1F4867|nr:AarF/UbiB family protein [Ornithinimicrobium sp. INDO-MA30-4]UJH71062.1 AarF/UbiB family protein [Ornithinimicrobium sp. INDO-MA30-4]